MNMYKHSPFPKLVASRLKRKNNFNPDKITSHSYKNAQNIDILDVYKFRELREVQSLKAAKVAEGDRSVEYWKGGDK